MATVLSGMGAWPDGFVFLRPAWLLAIPPLLLVVHRLARRLDGAGWQRHIAPDKLAHLRLAPARASVRHELVIGASLALACVALAGPSWRTSPGTLASDRQAMVMLLDLSPSMLARDVAPDRLTRARLKLVDLLRRRAGAESALIVYAADAFRVAPLTDDPAVVEALVPTLHPDIMPQPGSRPERAVELALTLFDGAGLERGDIVALTDGMHPDAVAAIGRRLPPEFRLSILGVGTATGAPIPDAGSGHLRDARGRTVLAALDAAPLAGLATRSGGRYTPLTIDDADVEHLDALARLPFDPRIVPPDERFDRRDDAGYWLLLPLLPLLAYGFRRHLLWAALPLLLTAAPDAHAFDWRSLWLNDDQRAARALARGAADEAAGRFADARWRAVARYRAGDHAGAAASLAGADEPGDHYNRGNALALAGDLPAAVRAYERALALYPAGSVRAADVRFNRAEVLGLLEAERQAEAERTAAPPPRGGGGDDEEGDSGEPGEPADADEPPDAATPQREVGGAAGAAAGTLDQRSLDGEGRATSTRRDGSPEPGRDVPDDATPVPGRQAVDTAVDAAADPADARAADSTLPNVEDNANRVLSPYGERWLRALPHDPGGYLRRRFHYLAETRERAGDEPPREEVRY